MTPHDSSPSPESKTSSSSKARLETLDILQLLASLPHRYPFLMVDRILHIQGDESCVGLKNVTMNEPQFQGHFPERPIMPGVLLLEGMAQTAGAICVHATFSKKPPLVYFMTINNVKFRKPVVPGDQVEYHMTKINQRKNIWWYKGLAKVEGQIVCEAELSAMISAEPSPL